MRDVRLPVYVSCDIDDKLDDMASVTGLTKVEIIRQAIAQYMLGYDISIKLLRQEIKKMQ